MIEIIKQYTPRHGREVRIYATDGVGPYRVHGATLEQDGWTLQKWAKNGNSIAGSNSPKDEDLVEAWVPKDKEPVWCWDSDEAGKEAGRNLSFWDAKHNSTFRYGGKRDGSTWRHYAEVEHIEQWMLDIQAKLEDQR